MDLERRIKELEKRFKSGEIILRMPDGTEQKIKLGRGQDGLDLLVQVTEYPNSPIADAIRRSVSAREPGGGRMCEMARAILPSPEETELKETIN